MLQRSFAGIAEDIRHALGAGDASSPLRPNDISVTGYWLRYDDTSMDLMAVVAPRLVRYERLRSDDGPDVTVSTTIPLRQITRTVLNAAGAEGVLTVEFDADRTTRVQEIITTAAAPQTIDRYLRSSFRLVANGEEQVEELRSFARALNTAF